MSAARPEPEGGIGWREKLRPSPQMRQVMLIWLVLSLIATPLVVIFLGPELPPGSASDAAHGQQQDNTVMTALVTPIVIALLVYFIYALVAFRRPEGDTSDGAPVRGDAAIMAAWVSVTFVIVIFLAAWGSYELFPGETGAGGGLGPTPLAIAKPADASSALRVQVIGQQWAWTFRYPTYGGVESTELVLPVNRQIRFSVTSIDVVHSFWANKLGVKADAIPNTSNVAFAKPVKIESSTIRCSELCGLWHGQMYAPLHVVSAARFATWIAEERKRTAPIKRYLPPYAPHYAPEPTFRSK